MSTVSKPHLLRVLRLAIAEIQAQQDTDLTMGCELRPNGEGIWPKRMSKLSRDTIVERGRLLNKLRIAVGDKHAEPSIYRRDGTLRSEGDTE